MSATLTEIKRLEIYQKEQEKNLPYAVLQADAGYKASFERLDELNAILAKEELAKAESAEKEAVRIAESKELLESINADISKIIDEFDTKFTNLHPSHKPRFLEIMKELKKLKR